VVIFFFAMDLRLWCAGMSGDPAACVLHCGCGFCDGVAAEGACLAIPDFNLCRPMLFESFTSNCTAYTAPDTNALTTDNVLISFGLALILTILVGVCVLGAKLYHVKKHAIYSRMTAEHATVHSTDD
jgi:hypothetical protein